ncbi:hypothetical protein D0Y65_026610 [Glycine soja]|uniref:HAT C-terminal dimerisation domain-containing protein n=1 Tax=Glycine soja TaxID=3848 RepID=A0A445IKL3_GLYSO|nr:hypothetical protein D0Y65_026610 [Glycine soja]
MVLQAIFNGAFLTMSSSSTTLFIGSSASTLVVVDSRHHQFPSLLFLVCGYNALRTSLLQQERSHIERLLQPIKSLWSLKGVTLVADGWIDAQRRPLINFMAISEEGPMFLKAIDGSKEYKDKHYMFDLLKDVIKEVGPQNVVQVIIDNAPVCKAARYYSDNWLNEVPNSVPPHRDDELSSQRNKCLKRYFPHVNVRSKVYEEFSKFSSCAGDFDSFDSIEDRWALDPKTWWVMHGSSTPILQKVALKLLVQPCSSSCCERNWSTYSFIHSLKRNKMDPKRAEDLVVVHFNLRLLSRKEEGYKKGETILWDINGDVHDPLDDNAGVLEMANLSLDEPDLEAMLFLDDGNGREENETIRV